MRSLRVSFLFAIMKRHHSMARQKCKTLLCSTYTMSVDPSTANSLLIFVGWSSSSTSRVVLTKLACLASKKVMRSSLWYIFLKSVRDMMRDSGRGSDRVVWGQSRNEEEKVKVELKSIVKVIGFNPSRRTPYYLGW